jgi:FkbM family methyltransferase
MTMTGDNEVPKLAALPRIYRLLLTLTGRHGLFTLARIHHRYYRCGQIVPLPGGGKMYIPGDSHYFGFLSGIHERHVLNVIDAHLFAGDVCLDVGANIGYFAMLMADRVGANGKVYAFEPVPETYDVLSLNAKLAGDFGLNLVPIRAAVSSDNGELSICRSTHSTLHQVRALSEVSEKELERVSCTTLASALEKLEPNALISLLKIDVEGHELSVLEGAQPVLRSGRVRRMIIEVTPGDDAAAIGRLLGDCRATLRCWLNGRWHFTPLVHLPSRTDVLVEFPI